MRWTPPVEAIALGASLLAAPLVLNAQDVKVGIVKIRVKDGASWTPSAGSLYRIGEDAQRRHAANVNEEGRLDTEVKCKASDRFEADAESRLDRPVKPVRLPCSAALDFSFTRAVYAAWPAGFISPEKQVAAAPLLYSDYGVRTAEAGNQHAADAFSDAAIASTAKLLGDAKLDQYVQRDPLQDFKLVFTPAGVDALKARQKAAGMKPSGQLDSATQSLFAKDVRFPGRSPATSSALSCDMKFGQMLCALPRESEAIKGTVRFPPISFER